MPALNYLQNDKSLGAKQKSPAGHSNLKQGQSAGGAEFSRSHKSPKLNASAASLTQHHSGTKRKKYRIQQRANKQSFQHIAMPFNSELLE